MPGPVARVLHVAGGVVRLCRTCAPALAEAQRAQVAAWPLAWRDGWTVRRIERRLAAEGRDWLDVAADLAGGGVLATLPAAPRGGVRRRAERTAKAGRRTCRCCGRPLARRGRAQTCQDRADCREFCRELARLRYRAVHGRTETARRAAEEARSERAAVALKREIRAERAEEAGRCVGCGQPVRYCDRCGRVPPRRAAGDPADVRRCAPRFWGRRGGCAGPGPDPLPPPLRCGDCSAA